MIGCNQKFEFIDIKKLYINIITWQLEKRNCKILFILRTIDKSHQVVNVTRFDKIIGLKSCSMYRL